jgi:hypothetical protein
VTQDELVLKTRAGQLVHVDLTQALQAGNVAAPVPGEAAIVLGTYAAGGILVATNLEHAKQQPSLWPQDQ